MSHESYVRNDMKFMPVNSYEEMAILWHFVSVVGKV